MRESPSDGSVLGKPSNFQEAAEWTGGCEDGEDGAVRFRCPGGVSQAKDGTIYVSDAYNHCIRKRAPDTGVWSTLAGKLGQKGFQDSLFAYPQRCAVDDGNGVVVVAGGGSHAIHCINPQGIVRVLAGVPGSAGHADGESAMFNRPIGLALDSATGDVYVGDVGGHVVRKVTKAGVVTTLAGKYKERGFADGVGEEIRFNQPCGLSFVPSSSGGSLIIADCNNHCIRELSLEKLSVVTIAGKAGEGGHADGAGEAARFLNPSDVCLQAGGVVTVADNGNHCVRKLVLADKAVTTLCGTPGLDGFCDSPDPSSSAAADTAATAAFFFPNALCSLKEQVLVADTWNHSIRRVLTGADSDSSGRKRLGGERDAESEGASKKEKRE